MDPDEAARRNAQQRRGRTDLARLSRQHLAVARGVSGHDVFEGGVRAAHAAHGHERARERRGLRGHDEDYAATYAGKNPSTADFQRIVEKHATKNLQLTNDGKLDWFFDEWVHGTAIPKYESWFDVQDAGGGKFKIKGSITQSGVPDTFAMPVPRRAVALRFRFVTYREIAPTAALRPWVECFWTRGLDGAAAAEQRVLPDGCADLVFDLTAGEGMAVGTMTKPLVLPAIDSEFLGVRFRPGRAAAFLRLPLAEITDARVPLRDLWNTWDGQLSIPAMESELIRRLRPGRDARVDAAIERIVTGAHRIDDIARDVGISRQHLARQFQHHVGVSPKTFARVMRFRRLLADRGDDWTARAARHGYYDQSHLIADFRELAGTTPSAFHFSNP